MTIKSLVFLALLAPLTVVGCASDTTDDAGASSEGDELSGSGPNAWQHQGQPLSCAQTIAAKVTKTSRRHAYDFAAEAGTKATLSLSGTWPASLGARVYVTDPSGTVIATAKQDAQNTVSVTAPIAAAGTYLVSVSPIKYQQVSKTYSYKLTAACEGSLSCASASITWDGSTTPTSYLQNVSSQAQAEEFFASFPGGASLSQRTGACDQSMMCPALYKPVCGVINNDPQKTFSNACSFHAALEAAAGHTAGQGAKGYVVSDGACVEPVCNYDQPNKHYVVQGADKCKLAKFACPAGQTGFGDECGCGCEWPAAPVCDYNQPNKHYIVQSAEQCKAVKYACPTGQTGFSDECGCGCEGPAAPVCDYNQPGKHYIVQSAEQCKAVKYSCPAGQNGFSDECGCGCTE